MSISMALAGNPNSGKTTLFNFLTGARQHVGNWPGVTVKKKQGTCILGREKIEITDLPGIYSLTADSVEEVVVRNFLIHETPDLIVNILDAANLERNLYLTLQLMELGVPVCLVLNMMDIAEKRGIRINVHKLSRRLGVPVIPCVARSGKGNMQLIESVQAVKGAAFPPLKISYGPDIDGALSEMQAIITESGFLTEQYPARWTALKYLENDTQMLETGKAFNLAVASELTAISFVLSSRLTVSGNMTPEALIAEKRYVCIQDLISQGTVEIKEDPNLPQVSDRMDQVFTHPVLGPLIMVVILLALYYFTFSVSELPIFWLEAALGWIRQGTAAILPDGLLKSLVISGIIDGVGAVVGFIPLIMFMFLGICFLEDTGYLSRMAYMLDRIFRVFGLHGSSVLAFIVSGGIAGGCAVPGVMATRTLRSTRERLATLLTVPFMNCGAKLPVFVLLVGAFFRDHQPWMMMLITLVSWAGALVVALLLRSTLIRGEATPFVMELAPYRLPTLRGLFIHTWERTWQYLKKAGTLILMICVLLWAMMTFPGLAPDQAARFQNKRNAVIKASPQGVMAEIRMTRQDWQLSGRALAVKKALAEIEHQQSLASLKNSVAGRLGSALETVSQLAGFDWRTNIALVGGFAAKEVVVSTLGMAYSMGTIDPEESAGLGQRLKQDQGWGPVTALSLIVFTIFYAPCFVTVVCIARETGSIKWAIFSVCFNTGLAFALSVATFQIGRVFL